MSNYPIILIPPDIQQVKSVQPPAPTFTEQQPQKPGSEPEKVKTNVIAVEAAAVTVPSLAIASSDGGFMTGLLLFLAVGSAIAVQAWRQITTYPQRLREHSHQVSAYSGNLRVYNRKKRQYEVEVRAAGSPEKLAEFQYKLLLDILRRTVPHDDNGSGARSGAAEARFGDHLERYFPDKIQTGLKVQNPSYSEGYHYTPDFAYIDRHLNLYIDIEIDEPYNAKGEPIHFVGLKKQQTRDEHFLSRGWIVIRFSEEQVVRWPQTCCKNITKTIAQVMEDSSMLNQFANVPDLQPMPQWTESEAIQMAATGYRDRYRR